MRRAVVAALILLLGWVSIHGAAPVWPQSDPPLFRSAGEFVVALRARVEQALRDAGHEWANVTVEGQTVRLSGSAPDIAARADAIRVARAAWGPGGRLAGAVAHVDADGIDVLARVTTYRFVARWSGAGLQLAGHAPDRATAEAIRAHARALGIDEVAGELTLAAGAPRGADWEGAARFGLAALVELTRGELTIEDRTMTLDGVVGAEPLRAEMEAALARAPAPFVGSAAIRVESAARRAAALSSAAAEAAGCQERLERALGSDTVAFHPGSASLTSPSQAALERVAASLRACGEVRLDIAVSAGSAGDPGWNQELERRRARAIVGVLVAHGADADRMFAAPPQARTAEAADLGEFVAFTVSE